MPQIKLRDGHYYSSKRFNHGDNVVGISVGDKVTFYDNDETFTTYVEEGKSYIKMFKENPRFDLPLDGSVVSSYFFDEDFLIDDFVACCRMSSYYIEYMNKVINNIKQGNFIDLLQDKIEDVISDVMRLCHYVELQSDGVKALKSYSGTMGDIAVNVLSFQCERNRLNYNVLITKVNGVTHVYFIQLTSVLRRKKVGKLHYSHEEDRNINAEIAQIIDYRLNEFRPEHSSINNLLMRNV